MSPDLWSSDGSRIVYRSSRKGHYDLYQKPSSGAAAEEPILEDSFDKSPSSWSSDGRFILYSTQSGPTRRPLWVLPLFGERKPFPVPNTDFSGGYGQFSRDGRWIAYVSTEVGNRNVFVVPFPGPGGKWQISTGGGLMPRWRHDSSEIYYVDPENKSLMAATVNGKGQSLEVGDVKPLFKTQQLAGVTGYAYDVSPDGQRFLINTLQDQTVSAPITVVLNWTAELKKK